jgi:glycosyltransferase involved in cell wall biosynthesis
MAAVLANCRGRCALLMDTDLQHPVAMIPEFLRKWKEGAEIVFGVRTERNSGNTFRNLSAKCFYALYRKIGNSRMPSGASDFILLDRIVIDVFNRLGEKNRFTRGILCDLGFKFTIVEYVTGERRTGTTKWNHWKLLNYAIDGLTSSSTLPLQIWTYVGGLLVAGSIFQLIFSFFWAETSWLLFAVLLLAGVQLLALGILGEYVGRILLETKGRPLYLVRERINFDD